ncbi:MAG TPA: GNAT family N-acetyltransferase [Candidatus Saccharimonadales bacterium]|nr:GNAT family N-acetyltransferase [Candidatus Saccharimonadales bacterium]
MNLLERGETITIIRNSRIIGRLVPINELDVIDKHNDNIVMANTKPVVFRQFGGFETSAPLIKLHREALEAVGAYIDNLNLDADLQSPYMFYDQMDGELWVGELEDEIVAMGGFYLNLTGRGGKKQAVLKRMRVKPELQGRGIGTELLSILESKMKARQYKSIILDVTNGPDQAPARHLYEKFGFKETKRERAANFINIFYEKSL